MKTRGEHRRRGLRRLADSKGHALRDQLNWTHWRILLRVQDEAARNYYIRECVAENMEYTATGTPNQHPVL